MNQNRIGWIHTISIAVFIFTWGAMWTMWHFDRSALGFLFISILFLFLGIRKLHHLAREANAWHFNKTPTNFARAPKGSWFVMNTGLCAHMPHDNAVYVTIAAAPACDRALSTLRLKSEWLDIRDYKLIVDGKQPRGISIGDRITFTWE